MMHHCFDERKLNQRVPDHLRLGDSSLDFELRAWVLDVDTRLNVKSDFYHQLESKFRELNVVVPFPQRDGHFFSVDAPDSLSLPT